MSAASSTDSSSSRDIAGPTSGWLRGKGSFIWGWKSSFYVLTGTDLAEYSSSTYEYEPPKQCFTVARVERSVKVDLGFVITATTGAVTTLAAPTSRDFAKWLAAFTQLGQTQRLRRRASGPARETLERRRTCSVDDRSQDILLFVPTNAVPVHAASLLMRTDTRAAIAARQAAHGDHVPTRSTLEDPGVAWRVGKPDYAALDLLFLEGKTYNHKPGSVEWMVQNLIKTWEMEVSHKARLDQWTTVHPTLFQCSVNATPALSAQDLMRMGKYDAILATQRYDVGQSTRERSAMTFGTALPDGFAWEVLEVFSKPPRVSFSWRHWGVPKGGGDVLELFGFTVMDLDASMRICSLETFCKPEPFVDALEGLGLLAKDDARLSTRSLGDRRSVPDDSAKCPFAAKRPTNRSSIILDHPTFPAAPATKDHESLTPEVVGA